MMMAWLLLAVGVLIFLGALWYVGALDEQYTGTEQDGWD